VYLCTTPWYKASASSGPVLARQFGPPPNNAAQGPPVSALSGGRVADLIAESFEPGLWLGFRFFRNRFSKSRIHVSFAHSADRRFAAPDRPEQRGQFFVWNRRNPLISPESDE
jgi:hypothetical protein